MIISTSPSKDPEVFREHLQKMQKHPGVRSILILACDANGYSPDRIDPILKNCPLPLMGGIFPQIIAGNRNMEQGFILAGLSHELTCFVIPDLSGPDMDIQNRIGSLLDHKLCAGKTMFVFVDGLCAGISSLVQGLFNHAGLMTSYIGGGAGSLSFEQKPCLFTGSGLLADAAVLGLSAIKSGIGVAHGWVPVSRALKVTEASGNRVISLNWEPAFQVYKNIIKSHSDACFEKMNFFDIAKAYPLGKVRLDAEMVVRDPIKTENDHLICVGEVPEGSLVYILHGNTDSLIHGADQARISALKNFPGNPARAAMLFMDCISRVLFMGNDFSRELTAVDRDGKAIGALTIGEIANTGDSYLEFYNKTAVIGMLENDSSI